MFHLSIVVDLQLNQVNIVNESNFNFHFSFCFFLVPLPPSSSLSNHLHHPTQRVILRKNFETTNPSPIDTNVSNESSTNKFLETSQHPTHNQRKLPSQNRSASKNPASRATVPTAATTIELLPPIIAGKRLHIPLANHRYL